VLHSGCNLRPLFDVRQQFWRFCWLVHASVPSFFSNGVSLLSLWLLVL
jgi:hypothetical protein